MEIISHRLLIKVTSDMVAAFQGPRPDMGDHGSDFIIRHWFGAPCIQLPGQCE